MDGKRMLIVRLTAAQHDKLTALAHDDRHRIAVRQKRLRQRLNRLTKQEDEATAVINAIYNYTV